jgi:transposase
MGDRLVSTLDHKLEPEVTGVRRLEVISGTGRRRRFTEEFKARVVEETLLPGTIVSEVARRHGLTPQQVFTWRRRARQPLAITESKAPQFVPAIVETALPPAILRGRQRKRTGQTSRSSGSIGSIEVEIDGMTIRIGRGAEAKTVAAVLRALKAGA